MRYHTHVFAFPSFSMSPYNDHLQWRYATKKFDATKKLTQEQLDELLASARLTASSYGLQPYKFVVITNPAIREKIKEHAWGQTQVTDASHLIAICSYKSIDVSYVDHFIDSISAERGIPVEGMKTYRDMMAGTIQTRTPEQLAQWMKCQSYIALGFLLSAAAQMEIDSCPMEGFDPTQVDIDLDLASQNLTCATLLPVGFRAADDETAKYKKVRFPNEELFIFKN